MKDLIKSTAGLTLAYAPKKLQTKVKELAELVYWKKVLRRSGGTFYNGHFKGHFTDLFDLTYDDFSDLEILDVGCGPLGSLEWAKNAKRRVGVDPLASAYKRLNRNRHEMEYVCTGAETLPFPDESFDLVSTFNSLDHVENLEACITEIQRVTRRGGRILLIVEIDHAPSITEPQKFGEEILDAFDTCEPITKKIFAINDHHNIYQSIVSAEPRKKEADPAILCSSLRKLR